MPRNTGIGRNHKKRRVALAEVANKAAPRSNDEPDTAAEEPEPGESTEDWVSALLFDVADAAVDEQRRVNWRFMKYAATASACAASMRACSTIRDENVCEQAWSQAHAELECVCLGVDSPYSSVSSKYRCEYCGTVVCRCLCEVTCDCGNKVAKWSWRAGDLRNFGSCYCRGRSPFRRDWAWFDRGAGRSPV